jgi:hypothetical protein
MVRTSPVAWAVVKTRTLLILATVCGALILVAGGVQLIRLSGQPKPAAALEVGATGKVGDARVTVLAVTITGEAVTIDVALSGVDDSDGLDGFALLQPGNAAEIDAATTTCSGLTVAEQRCTLGFVPAASESELLQLLFRRADAQARWTLAA